MHGIVVKWDPPHPRSRMEAGAGLPNPTMTEHGILYFTQYPVVPKRLSFLVLIVYFTPIQLVSSERRRLDSCHAEAESAF